MHSPGGLRGCLRRLPPHRMKIRRGQSQSMCRKQQEVLKEEGAEAVSFSLIRTKRLRSEVLTRAVGELAGQENPKNPFRRIDHGALMHVQACLYCRALCHGADAEKTKRTSESLPESVLPSSEAEQKRHWRQEASMRTLYRPDSAVHAYRKGGLCRTS